MSIDSDTLSQKIEELGDDKAQTSQYDILTWQPSDREKYVISKNRELFRNAASARNQNFENFDGLNLVQYIEESYRRYNSNVNIRDDIEDWQSVVRDKFTANKVDAILAKVVSVLPIAEIVGRGDEDIAKGLILSNLYEYSEEVDDYEHEILLEGFEQPCGKVEFEFSNLYDYGNSKIDLMLGILFISVSKFEEYLKKDIQIRNLPF